MDDENSSLCSGSAKVPGVQLRGQHRGELTETSRAQQHISKLYYSHLIFLSATAAPDSMRQANDISCFEESHFRIPDSVVMSEVEGLNSRALINHPEDIATEDNS